MAIVVMIGLRIPSLFEGFWYGDEGIYAALAQGMHDGKQLYTQVWDHKPPAIYWLYFIAGFIADWFVALVAIKVVAIICSGISLWLIDKITAKMSFSSAARKVALVVGVVLLGLPLLEANIANAEVFFLPLNLAVTYLLLQQRWYIAIGVLASLGAIFKFHSGFESAVLVALMLMIQQFQHSLPWKTIGRRLALITLGGLAILVPYGVYVLLQGTTTPVLDAILWYNFQYTSYATEGIALLGVTISSSMLLLAGLGLILSALYVLTRKQLITFALAIIAAVIAVEYIAAMLPGRPYGHYLLQIIPGATLATALIADRLIGANYRQKLLVGLGGTVIAFLLMAGFLKGSGLYGPGLIGQYYTEFFTEFVMNQPTNDFPYDQGVNSEQAKKLAGYIDRYHTDKDYYFYGNLPWLFALTSNQFTNTFVVWYHRPYDHPVNMADQRQADLVVVDTTIWQADLLIAELDSAYQHQETYDNYTLLWR